MSDPIEVGIDADLEPLIPGYLQNRRRDLVSLEQLLDAGDFEAIVRIGHGMKGSGGGYGFAWISELGARMETAAKSGDADAVRGQRRELEDFLDRLVIHFEDV